SARTGRSASRGPLFGSGSPRSGSTARARSARAPGGPRPAPRGRRRRRGRGGGGGAASQGERGHPHVSAAPAPAARPFRVGYGAERGPGPRPSERVRGPGADGREPDDAVEVGRDEADDVEGEPVAEEPDAREDEEAGVAPAVPQRDRGERLDEQLHAVVELGLGADPDDDAVGHLDVLGPDAAERAAEAERDGARLVAEGDDAVGDGEEPVALAVAEGEERSRADGHVRRLPVVDPPLDADERGHEGAVAERDEPRGEEVDAVAEAGRDGGEDVGEVAAERAGAHRPGRGGEEEARPDGVRPEEAAA